MPGVHDYIDVIVSSASNDRATCVELALMHGAVLHIATCPFQIKESELLDGGCTATLARSVR